MLSADCSNCDYGCPNIKHVPTTFVVARTSVRNKGTLAQGLIRRKSREDTRLRLHVIINQLTDTSLSHTRRQRDCNIHATLCVIVLSVGVVHGGFNNIEKQRKAGEVHCTTTYLFFTGKGR
jgi:hypothetical protein